jgi:hypothetical protein
MNFPVGLFVLMTSLLISVGAQATEGTVTQQGKRSVENDHIRSIAEIIKTGYSEPYLALTHFQCGKLTIDVATSCAGISQERRRSICYAQAFTMKAGSNVKDFFFFKTNFRNDDTIAYQATCVAENNQKSWLFITTTDFGSGRTCIDCERQHYFDDEGSYLGSTESVAIRRLIPGIKPIPEKISSKISGLWANPTTSKQTFVINAYPAFVEKE